MDRRHFLAAASGFLGGIAGCGQGRPGEQSPGRLEPTTRVKPSPTPSPTPESTRRESTDEPTDRGTETATPPTDVPDQVGLETIGAGFRIPLDLSFVPNSDLRYVAQQHGTIRVIEEGGVRSTPLLDLRDAVSTGYEKGLLGICLHPEFSSNRRLFVRYSAPPGPETPEGFDHTFVLSEFSVSQDGLRASRTSEREIMTIPEPQSNHNAGSIAFGPDGNLFVGVGDGGAGGDQGTGHVQDWYGAVQGGNGQDVTSNLLGSILRIDVDDTEDGKAYAIPDSNPLVGEAGLDEHYAWGFRNPWRLSLDQGTLYAGDVGQGRYEEVDRVNAGGNYGWNVKEGTHCFGSNTCPDHTPKSVRGGEPLLDPVIEYPHKGPPVSGISVIIGNIYRGTAVPGLQGRFVFGDLRANGRLFLADPGTDGLWPTQALPIAEQDARKLGQIYSFRRHEGEIYVLGSGEGGGGVHRVISSS
ncbi:MAG: sorbosone dehydrogenase family protein [Halodesulfurarchaeum sp.]